MCDLNNAVFIEVSADVRYWEDGEIDGVVDTEGKMPLRNGDSWEPIIELATGLILNWPSTVSAQVHYKVCDAGEYWLLDAHQARIAKWAGHYVPADILCAGKGRHSDYIILNIGGDGRVIGWNTPILQAERWVEIDSSGADSNNR